MKSIDPVTVADFRKAWNDLVKSKEETNDIPLHPFASFRLVSQGKEYCRACTRQYVDRNQFEYGKLCFGKRKWWIFGRLICPRVAHFHVKCLVCKASWFESMTEKDPRR